MAKPNIPDPGAAARKVKELAKELDPSAAARRVAEMAKDLDPTAAALKVRDAAKDIASDLTDTYRKSNKFLRLRAGIVGGWVLLSLVALLAAFHTAEREEATMADTIVGRVVSFKNTSDENWTDVTLTLDGGWTHFVRTIRPGQDLGVEIGKFKKDGQPAPLDLNPRWIEIDGGQVDKKLKISRQ